MAAYKMYACALLVVSGTCCWALTSWQLDLLERHFASELEQDKREAMEEMEKVFRTECTNGDDEQARQRYMASFRNAYTCINLQRSDIRAIFQADDAIQYTAQLICKKYTTSKQCIGKYVRDIKLCEMGFKFPRKVVKTAINDIIDFVCEGGSTRMEGVLREISPDCAEVVGAGFDSCDDELDAHENLTWDAEGCRILNETQECITDQIKTCGGPNLAETVDGIAAIGMRHLPCSRLSRRSRALRSVSDLPLSPGALLRGPAQFYGAALSPLLPPHPLRMN